MIKDIKKKLGDTFIIELGLKRAFLVHKPLKIIPIIYSQSVCKSICNFENDIFKITQK